MTVYEYRCDVTRVIDGDTVEVEIDLGFYLTAKHRVRLLGVDAPELFSGTDREAGAAAKTFVEGWVGRKKAGLRYPFRIRTEKADSFGRWLGNLTAIGDDPATAATLSEELVEHGHAEWRTK
jgi:micrococcal nuclease